MRYRLRTLLILLTVLPPLLAAAWTHYEAWKAECHRREAEEKARQEAVARQRLLDRLYALIREVEESGAPDLLH